MTMATTQSIRSVQAPIGGAQAAGGDKAGSNRNGANFADVLQAAQQPAAEAGSASASGADATAKLMRPAYTYLPQGALSALEILATAGQANEASDAAAAMPDEATADLEDVQAAGDAELLDTLGASHSDDGVLPADIASAPDLAGAGQHDMVQTAPAHAPASAAPRADMPASAPQDATILRPAAHAAHDALAKPEAKLHGDVQNAQPAVRDMQAGDPGSRVLSGQVADQVAARSEAGGESPNDDMTAAIASTVTSTQQETYFAPAGGAAAAPVMQVARAVAGEVASLAKAAPAAAAQAAQPAPTLAPQVKVLELKLEPQNLGVVTVRMAMAGDHLRLKVATPSREVAQHLQNDAEVLNKVLQSAGCVVDSLVVQVSQGETKADASARSPNYGEAQNFSGSDTARGGEGGRFGAERGGQQHGRSPRGGDVAQPVSAIGADGQGRAATPQRSGSIYI